MTGTSARGRNILAQPQFGLRLKAVRQSRGISQAQLAGHGMSTTYLSRLESGDRPATPRAVNYLCDKLDLPQSFFHSGLVDSTTEALALVLSQTEQEGGTQLILDAMRAEAAAHPLIRWQSLWVLSQQQHKSGARPAQLATLTELTALSDEIDHPLLRVRARVQLARCQRSSGEPEGTYRTCNEALALVDEHDLPPSDRTRVLLALISAEAETGRLAEAVAHTGQALELLDSLPRSLRCETLWTASSIRGRQGQHTAAAELLEEAMALLPSGEDLPLWLRLRLAASALYLRMDPPRTDEAERHLDTAAPAVALLNVPVHQQEFQCLRARLAFHRQEYATAWELCEGLGENPEHLTYQDRIRHRTLVAQLRILKGEQAAAVADLQRLARQAQEAANIDLSAEVWRALAESLTYEISPSD
ncbi:helix-turn-helix domain-containing protein [Streptomyces sp. BBFR2]|uniref:helix-turn-helix domain-containing protein n=1 Tax=Streptomyces sp. BBFR2 TaxID=3372854 RepID=UPI0037DA1C45